GGDRGSPAGRWPCPHPSARAFSSLLRAGGVKLGDVGVQWGRRLIAGTALAGVASAGAACGSSGSKSAGGAAKLTVDSTVAPITDIVRQVVGDRVNLVGLIPEGVDSHTFEPSPATVKSLTKADVLF